MRPPHRACGSGGPAVCHRRASAGDTEMLAPVVGHEDLLRIELLAELEELAELGEYAAVVRPPSLARLGQELAPVRAKIEAAQLVEDRREELARRAGPAAEPERIEAEAIHAVRRAQPERARLGSVELARIGARPLVGFVL